MTHGVVSMLKVREFASTLVNCVVPTGYGNYYAIKRADDLKLFDLEDLKHMMKINRVYLYLWVSFSQGPEIYSFTKDGKKLLLNILFFDLVPFPEVGGNFK